MSRDTGDPDAYIEHLAEEIADSQYHREILYRLHEEGDLSYRALVFDDVPDEPHEAGQETPSYQPRNDWGAYHRAFCELHRKTAIAVRGVKARSGRRKRPVPGPSGTTTSRVKGLRNVSSDDIDAARASITDFGERLYENIAGT